MDLAQSGVSTDKRESAVTTNNSSTTLIKRAKAAFLTITMLLAGLVLAGPTATPAQAATTTIRVCSQDAGFYNIQGANAQSLREKLDNPANFGPAGAYGDFDFEYVTVGANFTEATIVGNSCDLWYSGYEPDSSYSPAELTELQNWVTNNNGQVMAGCDGTGNDPVCDLLDFTVTTDTDTYGFIVEKVLNPLTCDGLLDPGDQLNMAGGVGGYFSGAGVTTDNVLAVHETIGVADPTKPIVVYTGNFFFTSDINMMQTGGTELTLSDGPGVTTNNDIMAMNAFSSLADAAVGNPVCSSVTTDINLAPGAATNFVGESHELTATVTSDDPEVGTPVVGIEVTFTVVAGPHIGTSGSGITDAAGVATFSYVGTTAGVDTIQASFVDDDGKTQPSNVVTKTWEAKPIEIDLDPDTAINDLGTQPTHTVTATVLLGGAPVEGAVVEFTVDGASGPHGPTGVATDAAGQASLTYPGATLGFDSITACVEGDVCDVVEKQWVDATPPVAQCVAGPNPSGNIPQAPGEGRRGQNQDGFYTIIATDLVDPNPEVFVLDTGSGFMFGPYPSGTNIKYTEANGAKPTVTSGSGVVAWNLKGKGDAAVFAVDASGNVAELVDCLVPPAPQ